MGKVFTTKGFDRWSKNHDVEDAALIEAIDLANQGVVAAHPGGGLITTRKVVSNEHMRMQKSNGKKFSGATMTRTDPSETRALAYENAISATVHEGLEGLFELGLVSNEEMRLSDESCLVAAEGIEFPDIAGLRKREHISQSVLARYLGVATATVGQWERGLRRPDGPVLKLLSLIERNGLDYIR